MEILVLKDETYKDLLELKNWITIKTREITNPEILSSLKSNIPLHEQFNPREIDYEPEYSLSDSLSQVISSVWSEQETGKVNYIT